MTKPHARAYADAKILSSETNWKVLELLREVGIEGLSTEEISKKLKVPKPSVYSILSRLAAAKYVASTTKRQPWGRPKKEARERSGGKPTRVFIESVSWGANVFDGEFIDSLDPILKNLEKDIDDLRKKWLSVLEKVILAYQTNDQKRFYPQDPIHDECGKSHEAQEFLDAISMYSLYRILDGKDFDELERKHKFMK